ncbi:transcription antitermination factor NusB [Treponema sp. OMZ 840]|uniref:transcription antitermination factor NusB n=1 Tax=Treponema sp. OMZ 840 TaxID=244313 RepID=UPI003D913938
MARRKSRILAFQALYAWDSGTKDEKTLLDFSWASEAQLERIGEDGKTFARLIIGGTLEAIDRIDAVISRHLVNWEIGRLNKVDLAVLRMSVYSLLFQKDIHPSIVINEAVDISREYGSDDAFRFVNGVLASVKSTLETENRKL